MRALAHASEHPSHTRVKHDKYMTNIYIYIKPHPRTAPHVSDMHDWHHYTLRPPRHYTPQFGAFLAHLVRTTEVPWFICGIEHECMPKGCGSKVSCSMLEHGLLYCGFSVGVYEVLPQVCVDGPPGLDPDTSACFSDLTDLEIFTQHCMPLRDLWEDVPRSRVKCLSAIAQVRVALRLQWWLLCSTLRGASI